MSAFPIDLRVKGWPVAIIGNSNLGARRGRALIEAGAELSFYLGQPEVPQHSRNSAPHRSVSYRSAPHRSASHYSAPHPNPAIVSLGSKNCTVHRGLPSIDDGPFRLILVSESSPELWGIGQGLKVHQNHMPLLSLFGNQEDSDLRFGAITHQEPFSVGVFSSGQLPGGAVLIRDHIANSLGEALSQQAKTLIQTRHHIRQSHPEESSDQRAARLSPYIDSLESLLPEIESTENVSFPESITATPDGELQSRPQSIGKVVIVGAGPGASDLITLRGRRWLERADLILADALVSPSLYRSTSASKSGNIIFVGKRAQGPRVPQALINRWMIDAAQQGHLVVRLKGGDPGIFGRLREELQALEQAGVSYEVVPGISSALSGGLFAFGGLTERFLADRVSIHTGTSIDANRALPAYHPDETQIWLMAYRRRHALSQNLLGAGYPSSLPVALLAKVSTPDEQRWFGSLEKLAQEKDPPLERPVVLVLGMIAHPTQVLSPSSYISDANDAESPSRNHGLGQSPL